MAEGKVAWPSWKVLVTCLARCYLVGANFNTRGMQNIGLAFAMDPGLRIIHSTDKDLAQARRRYLKHYNTHPFWTPLLVGVFLKLEYDIARQRMRVDMLENIKTTTTYTLSAIGDSLFGGGLFVTWTLVTACFLTQGMHTAAMTFAVGLLALFQAFKVYGFVVGLREGMKVLMRLKKIGLIDWSRRVKCLNAVLLVVFWYLIWPAEAGVAALSFGIGMLLLAAWLVERIGLARELIVVLAVAGYLSMPWLGPWLTQFLGR